MGKAQANQSCSDRADRLYPGRDSAPWDKSYQNCMDALSSVIANNANSVCTTRFSRCGSEGQTVSPNADADVSTLSNSGDGVFSDASGDTYTNGYKRGKAQPLATTGSNSGGNGNKVTRKKVTTTTSATTTTNNASNTTTSDTKTTDTCPHYSKTPHATNYVFSRIVSE